jgi:DNA-binding transcriptional ArsR family regulator
VFTSPDVLPPVVTAKPIPRVTDATTIRAMMKSSRLLFGVRTCIACPNGVTKATVACALGFLLGDILSVMVKSSARSLDLTFRALADPTRRAILARLAKGEATVGELSRPFRISAPAISRHLRVLEHAGLIRRERHGRLRRCRLVARPMKDAVDWMAGYRSFWEGRLDALERHLTKTPGRK